MDNYEYLIIKWTLGFSFFGLTLLFLGKLGKLVVDFINKNADSGHLLEFLREVISK